MFVILLSITLLLVGLNLSLRIPDKLNERLINSLEEGIKLRDEMIVNKEKVIDSYGYVSNKCLDEMFDMGVHNADF